MRTEVTATYAGTTTELLDGLGRTTRFERDQSGLTTAVTDAQGYRTSLMLDDDLRPTEVRADGQFAARLHYDAQGRVQQVQASDAIYDYRHDQQGRLVSRSTDGAVTTFTYDGLSGRVSDIVSPDRVVQYGYDAQARLDTVSDGDTELDFQSDAAGLIQAVNRDGERLLSYTYTGNGVPATIRHGDNVATANQTFDERGFRTSIQYAAEGYDVTSQIEYDGIGNLIAISAQSEKSDLDVSQGYELDPYNELIRVTQGHDQTADMSFFYDSMGRVHTAESGGATALIEYDYLDRITAVTLARSPDRKPNKAESLGCIMVSD